MCEPTSDGVDPEQSVRPAEVLGNPVPFGFTDDLTYREGHQRLDLRGRYANGALIGVAVQLAIADAVFIAYGFGVKWNIPTPAIATWLSATVVEVIGVVLVITRSLFPDKLAEHTPGS
jgi:hypothetical protein